MELYTALMYGIIVIMVYKLLDRLIRIPKIEGPTGHKKNILVTGCDTGFGNIFAKRMASKGFTIFAGCFTDQGMNELSLQTYAGKVVPFKLDVTKEESIAEGYTFVCSKLPETEGLWAIINNSGITGNPGPLEWLTKQDLSQVMDVNVFGMFLVTKYFLPLVKKTRGRIVNTCSIVGRFVLPFAAPYMTSKYAAEALSDGMRVEMIPFGISVHILEPGFFATALTNPANVNALFNKVWDRLNPAMKEEYGEEFLKGCEVMSSKVLPLVGSKNLNLVVDCYEHAVTATYPRARYMPGYDSKYLFWPLSHGPEWLSDFVLNLTSRLVVSKPKGCKKR